VTDVAVLGAGIVGCSAAALLAEAGAEVTVVERERVGAGASGRNSGVLQHPLDPRLVALHHRTVELHRQVADLTDEPDGLLLVGATSADGLPGELEPEMLGDAAEAEPLLRAGTPAVRLNTGWVVGPTALTEAWWRRAEAAGARLVTGDEPPPRASTVLRATGAWTAGVTPLWGVTARVRTRSAPRHVLEEAGVEAIVDEAGGELFSLVGDVLGSSFSREEPDVNAVRRRIEERATRFIGAVDVTSARACPRPQSPDGLPLAGRLDERTWVCAGHGPWGISAGPATAELVVSAMRGGEAPPAELDPLRFER
jgi:glycine/D-amino acid oxidase-like deaminating enzyme